jgi:hypothetical protein
MSTKRAWPVVLSVILALVLVVSAIGAIRSRAAPLPIPTPVSNPSGRISSATGPRYPINFFKDQPVTADLRGAPVSLSEYNILDIQFVIDQVITTPNTVTLKVQYSNDGVNWVSGANLVADNAADATDLIQLNNYGRYTAIYADVTNTETITVSVIAVAK